MITTIWIGSLTIIRLMRKFGSSGVPFQGPPPKWGPTSIPEARHLEGLVFFEGPAKFHMLWYDSLAGSGRVLWYRGALITRIVLLSNVLQRVSEKFRDIAAWPVRTGRWDVWSLLARFWACARRLSASVYRLAHLLGWCTLCTCLRQEVRSYDVNSIRRDLLKMPN